MSGVALAILTVVCLGLGALCGLLSWVMLGSTEVPRRTAFGWGAVLGPVGLIVAAVLLARSDYRQQKSEGG